MRCCKTGSFKQKVYVNTTVISFGASDHQTHGIGRVKLFNGQDEEGFTSGNPRHLLRHQPFFFCARLRWLLAEAGRPLKAVATAEGTVTTQQLIHM